MFYKKSVLKNLKGNSQENICVKGFFNKVGGLRPATLLNKRLQHKCFPVNFVKSFKNTFFTKHLGANAFIKYIKLFRMQVSGISLNLVPRSSPFFPNMSQLNLNYDTENNNLIKDVPFHLKL